MKKIFQTVSPFSLLLIPVFLFTLFTALKTEVDIPAEKYKASLSFQMPDLTEVITLIRL